MKRSEMIDLMNKFIGSVEYDKYMQVKDIDTLLFLMEKAGMQPPLIIEKSVLPGVSDFNVHKWEFENLTYVENNDIYTDRLQTIAELLNPDDETNDDE